MLCSQSKWAVACFFVVWPRLVFLLLNEEVQFSDLKDLLSWSNSLVSTLMDPWNSRSAGRNCFDLLFADYDCNPDHFNPYSNTLIDQNKAVEICRNESYGISHCSKVSKSWHYWGASLLSDPALCHWLLQQEQRPGWSYQNDLHHSAENKKMWFCSSLCGSEDVTEKSSHRGGFLPTHTTFCASVSLPTILTKQYFPNPSEVLCTYGVSNMLCFSSAWAFSSRT